MKYLSLLLLISITMGCGYRWGDQGSLQKYRTISVPYVIGDWSGSLTAALVKEISVSGVFAYSAEGSVTLRVRVIDYDDENIGFQYDRNKEGKIKNILLPDETRTTALAEVTLIETISGRTLLGPVQIAADVAFDHDYYATRHRVNVFSLGQLTDIDAAHDAAMKPLHCRLAKKIVEYLLVNVY